MADYKNRPKFDKMNVRQGSKRPTETHESYDKWGSRIGKSRPKYRRLIGSDAV
jgi:hypothetical protein